MPPTLKNKEWSEKGITIDNKIFASRTLIHFWLLIMKITCNLTCYILFYRSLLFLRFLLIYTLNFFAICSQLDPLEWNRFIDSSMFSLKAVTKWHPSVPVGYAANMKETYKSMELLLKHIQYTMYNWNIWGDLKAMARLLGILVGCTS